MLLRELLDKLGNWALYFSLGVVCMLMIVYILRHLVWAIRYPFLFLNWVQWQLYNPLRDYWKHPAGTGARAALHVLMLSGIAPLYWLLMHLALTPIRILNALYFDIVLYWSVVFCDSISELVHPGLSYRKSERKCNYVCRWIVYFPLRLFNVFKRNGLAIIEGVLMSGVDVVFPTYTMFHGTAFKGIATNIAQQGRWYVGSGDYAGSGIYFGLYRRTADHYAKGNDHALILARVTLFPCRNSATLPGRLKKKIGSDGQGISQGLSFPWRSIEHWRDHSYAQWFEYCLVQPHKSGDYVRTWRARPILVLKHHLPKRIWGGLSLWTGGAGGIGAIIFAWGTIGALVVLYKNYLAFLP